MTEEGGRGGWRGYTHVYTMHTRVSTHAYTHDACTAHTAHHHCVYVCVYTRAALQTTRGGGGDWSVCALYNVKALLTCKWRSAESTADSVRKTMKSVCCGFEPIFGSICLGRGCSSLGGHGQRMERQAAMPPFPIALALEANAAFAFAAGSICISSQQHLRAGGPPRHVGRLGRGGQKLFQ